MRVKTFLFLYTCICVTKPGEVINSNKELSLKQVVILSRHGLRSPLSKHLGLMTPRKWPTWKEKPGYLTAKGSVLEGFMGEFFGAWFSEKGLTNNDCPSEDIFYVYTNTKQRTRASAKAFVNKAFPLCNITIHHSATDVDPIFNPVIHNTSSIFRQLVTEDMQKSLKSLLLNSSYLNLETVLDYRNSELCKNENKCDLVTDKNKVIVASKEKPNIIGPIKIGNSVIDAFVMQYYEGFPSDDVGWGYLQTPMEWLNLMDVSKGYHNVIFNTTRIAHDISKPLIKYMRSIFFNENTSKVTLLMGHDANMYTVLKTLGFKPHVLPSQYELTPIGGKLVFQKWYDSLRKEYLLKVEYVYQSSEQLRDSDVLSLKNPPQFQTLELYDCIIDDKGFCVWDDFKKILDRD